MIFTKTQEAAIKLMRQDLRYLYTIIKNYNYFNSNYMISLMPYMGVIIDGVEDWLKSYNNSHIEKFQVPLFSTKEQEFYEDMRSSIKLWNNNYVDIYEKLKEIYYENDDYFASISNPIYKELRLYDFFGTDLIDGKFCGNTILCSFYIPSYSYYRKNGREIEKMCIIGGKYIACFNALCEYDIDKSIKFDTRDFGSRLFSGKFESSIGNEFNNRFVLFSVLCQINFILYCIDKFIIQEIPAKLRFSYLLYYYLLRIIRELNEQMGSNFILNNKWDSQSFRNAMAHYKLGISLKENEIDESDTMFGITNKFFGQGYKETKNSITLELMNLASQIEQYLNLV